MDSPLRRLPRLSFRKSLIRSLAAFGSAGCPSAALRRARTRLSTAVVSVASSTVRTRSCRSANQAPCSLPQIETTYMEELPGTLGVLPDACTEFVERLTRASACSTSSVSSLALVPELKTPSHSAVDLRDEVAEDAPPGGPWLGETAECPVALPLLPLD